jgi:hypothetical protein
MLPAIESDTEGLKDIKRVNIRSKHLILRICLINHKSQNFIRYEESK